MNDDQFSRLDERDVLDLSTPASNPGSPPDPGTAAPDIQETPGGDGPTGAPDSVPADSVPADSVPADTADTGDRSQASQAADRIVANGAQLGPSQMQAGRVMDARQLNLMLNGRMDTSLITSVTGPDGQTYERIEPHILDAIAIQIWGDNWCSAVVSAVQLPQEARNGQMLVGYRVCVRVTVWGRENDASQSHEATAVSYVVVDAGDPHAIGDAHTIAYGGAVTKARAKALGLFGECFGGLLLRDRNGTLERARAERATRRAATPTAPSNTPQRPTGQDGRHSAANGTTQQGRGLHVRQAPSGQPQVGPDQRGGANSPDPREAGTQEVQPDAAASGEASPTEQPGQGDPGGSAPARTTAVLNQAQKGRAPRARVRNASGQSCGRYAITSVPKKIAELLDGAEDAAERQAIIDANMAVINEMPAELRTEVLELIDDLPEPDMTTSLTTVSGPASDDVNAMEAETESSKSEPDPAHADSNPAPVLDIQPRWKRNRQRLDNVGEIKEQIESAVNRATTLEQLDALESSWTSLAFAEVRAALPVQATGWINQLFRIRRNQLEI